MAFRTPGGTVVYGPGTTPGNGAGGVGAVAPTGSSDWGAIWTNGLKRYGRLVVALAAIGAMAAYRLTRPLAWAVVSIALLSRAGALGPALQSIVQGIFGGTQ